MFKIGNFVCKSYKKCFLNEDISKDGYLNFLKLKYGVWFREYLCINWKIFQGKKFKEIFIKMN